MTYTGVILMKGPFTRGDEMTENEYILAIKRNSQRLFVIAFSYLQNKDDAEDALQNTFLKLWKTDTVFNDTEHMDKWLTRVCINECKNYHRQIFKKQCSIEESFDISTFDEYFNIDLFNAISSLQKKERLCIMLFYYDDMTTSDISKALGIKESTIKSILRRSREKLKQILGDEWINE